ncbi:MAG: hypothetical protein AAB436_02690 [Patescibacteria group bacterium]
MQPQDNNSPESAPTPLTSPSEPQIIKPTVISPSVAPAAEAVTPPSTPTPITPIVDTTPTEQLPPTAPVESTPPPQPVITTGNKPKRLKKFMIILLVLVLLLGGSAAAFYFGYYANPSLVYKQSLSNTAVGYDRLVDYVNEQSSQPSKGYIGTGSYNLAASSFDSKGKMAFKGDESNSEFTLDVGLGPNTLSADVITISSEKSASPDVYLKIDGLDDLSQLLGGAAMAPTLGKLNNTWVSVDHTMIDSLTQSAGGSGTTTDSPTNAQIVDEMKAFGEVNKDYLYSTDKEKAVLTLVKKYGVETVDGHKTYHYKVALNKANVKKYITAQRNALKASKLNDWLKKNGYDTSAYAYFDVLAQSADGIKSTDTFDMWSDLDQRIVYKFRVSDKSSPASNYVDVGLNYQGGDEYPFFMTFQSKSDKGSLTSSLTASLNTKTGNIGLKFNLKMAGPTSDTLTSEFNLKPSTSKITVAKPTGAVPLEQVIQQLGYGELYKAYLLQLQQASAAQAASPTTGSDTN